MLQWRQSICGVRLLQAQVRLPEKAVRTHAAGTCPKPPTPPTMLSHQETPRKHGAEPPLWHKALGHSWHQGAPRVTLKCFSTESRTQKGPTDTSLLCALAGVESSSCTILTDA